MVLVDDNELTVVGFASALRACPEIEVVAELDHREALGWQEQWGHVDVVVVDAADERLSGDQFPGVAVVQQVRAWQGNRRPLIVVVTGHFFNDGLRQRMAEVDADLFFERADLRTPKDLVDVVLRPADYRRGVPAVLEPDVRRRLGITERSRVQELVTYVDHHDLHSAFDGSEPARIDPRSRRWLQHRRAMAKITGIEPINLTTGRAPSRNQRFPSMRQFSELLRWATKITRPRADERRVIE